MRRVNLGESRAVARAARVPPLTRDGWKTAFTEVNARRRCCGG